jgi:hypothetical protein
MARGIFLLVLLASLPAIADTLTDAQVRKQMIAVSWSWEIGQGVKVYSSSDRGIRDEDETAVYV